MNKRTFTWLICMAMGLLLLVAGLPGNAVICFLLAMIVDLGRE